MPNPLDLERVRDYCAKATAGPWHLHFYNIPNNPVFALEAGDGGSEGEFGQLWGGGGTDEWPAGAIGDFIVNSRTDLPAAVEEIERLRAEVVEWTEATTRERSQRINYGTRIDMLTDELTTAQSELTELRREVERLKAEPAKMSQSIRDWWKALERGETTIKFESLKAERDKLAGMLKAAPCPNKCHSGAIIRQDDIEPCQWCAEVSALATLSEGEK